MNAGAVRSVATEMERAARRIAGLQRRARELKAQLREVTSELRVERRCLRAMVNVQAGKKFDAQTPPMRIFGESQLDK